jgi:hypothetical protein
MATFKRGFAGAAPFIFWDYRTIGDGERRGLTCISDHATRPDGICNRPRDLFGGFAEFI